MAAILAGFTLLAVAGCAHQPTRTPPAVSLPEHFSQSGAEAPQTYFWQAFNDIELDSLVTEALRGNHSLAAIRETLRQAQAVLIQQNAGRWPSVDAQLGVSRLGGAGNQNGNTYTASVAAAYELDVWGRVSATADAADLEMLATLENVRAANITLAADVTSTWYQLVGQRGLHHLQLEQIETNKMVLQLVQARFQQGQSDAADVLRQKVLLEQNRVALANYESVIVVLEHALAILVGKLPGGEKLPDSLNLPELPPLPDTGLTADWLQARPDIRSAFYAMQAADARTAAAIADRYPRIDLSASLNSSVTHASDLFEDWFNNLAANLLLPVFDAGSRKAEVSRTESVFRQQFENYQQAILVAVGEVEDALVQEQFQQRRLQHLINQKDLIDQVVKRLGLRYRSGNVDYLDVLQALTDQQQTEQDLVSAQQQLIEYRVALARALATGWPLDNEQQESHESKN